VLNSADLELAPLALVVAPNGGGKSSLAHAVASVVLGNAVVIDGVKQSEIGQLIHAGAAKAELAIKGICFSGDLGPMLKDLDFVY
jgi:chromosome segregation ATPase